MLGIRHVALKVRDIERIVSFYSKIMKMRIQWQPDGRNIYLTSGRDNLALHEVKDAWPPDKGPLDHFGFVVSKPEEVDEWAAWLRVQGVELVQEPKTHRDGARSIYFNDPEGNLVQIIYLPPMS